MVGAGDGGARQVERLAREQGYEIHESPHARHSWWVQVGERVLIFVPSWARGAPFREGCIARQMVLYGLKVCGPARFGQALATMRAAYARELAGAVPPPLPPLGDLGEGVAAD
jgi:hypothetical protein